VNGAPFSLVNRSDIVALHDGTEVRAMMIAELEAKRMPLAPVTIEDSDRDVLLEWLRLGAPAVSAQTCADGGTEDAGEPEDAQADGGTTDASAD
jgi:hypothetical protein